MDASTDAPANAAPLRADTREREIQADVTRHLQGAGETLRILGATFRFVVFCLYAVLGVIAFWLWVASSLLFLIRCLLNAVLAPLRRRRVCATFTKRVGAEFYSKNIRDEHVNKVLA